MIWLQENKRDGILPVQNVFFLIPQIMLILNALRDVGPSNRILQGYVIDKTYRRSHGNGTAL